MGRKDKLKKEKKAVDNKAKNLETAKKMLPKLESIKIKLEDDITTLKNTGLLIKFNPSRKEGELEDVMTDTDIKIEFKMDQIEEVDAKILYYKTILNKRFDTTDKANTNDNTGNKDPPTGGMGGAGMMAF